MPPPEPGAPAVDGYGPAAVYTRPGELAIEERPIPSPGPDEVVVEVSHCGICGSDLHSVLEGWGRPGSIPGHEWTGHVVAVGDDVAKWTTGAAVVGGPDIACGRCPHCLAGRPSLCAERGTPGKGEPSQGAFARYTRVREGQLLALPEGLSLREAALAEPLAVALHALTVGRVGPGQRALVLGMGPIGALALAALRARGVERVDVVEPNPGRRELARALGASSVRHPDALDVPSIAEPERIVDGAVDVVFECSGNRRAQEAGLAQLDRSGTLVLVGAGIDPPHFDGNRILLNELVVTGAYCYDDDGFPAALGLLASGAMPVDLLIEPDDVPLDGLLLAMRQLAAGERAGKVMVVPRVGAGESGDPR